MIQKITKPPLTQIIYYRGTERSTGSGGDGHMIKANNVVFESDCCEECWNPYGYTGLVFEVDHPAIADLLSYRDWEIGRAHV